MTDISALVRRRQRKAEREAALVRLRQHVEAGKLEIHWMSEEEKAAYRLREPLEPRATTAPAREADRREPGDLDPARAPAGDASGGPAGQREDPVERSVRVAWLAPIVQRSRAGYDALAGATFRMVRRARRTQAADPGEGTGVEPAPVQPGRAEQPPDGEETSTDG